MGLAQPREASGLLRPVELGSHNDYPALELELDSTMFTQPRGLMN